MGGRRVLWGHVGSMASSYVLGGCGVSFIILGLAGGGTRRWILPVIGVLQLLAAWRGSQLGRVVVDSETLSVTVGLSRRRFALAELEGASIEQRRVRNAGSARDVLVVTAGGVSTALDAVNAPRGTGGLVGVCAAINAEVTATSEEHGG